MTFPYRLPARPVAYPRPWCRVSGPHHRAGRRTRAPRTCRERRLRGPGLTFAINRRLPVPEFQVREAGGHLEIGTARFRLTSDRGPFTTSGLSLAVHGGLTA